MKAFFTASLLAYSLFLSAQINKEHKYDRTNKGIVLDVNQRISFKESSRALTGSRTIPSDSYTIKSYSNSEQATILKFDYQPSTNARTTLPSANELVERVADILELPEPISLNVYWDSPNQIRTQQQYKGISIYGSDVIINLTDQGYLSSVASDIVEINPQFDTTRQISSSEATAVVKKDLNITDVSAKSSVNCEFIIFPHQGKHEMAYEIHIYKDFFNDWIYVVSATSGEILDKFNQVCAFDVEHDTQQKDLNDQLQTIRSVQEEGTYYLIDNSKPMYNSAKGSGLIKIYDAKLTTGKVVEILSNEDNIWAPEAVSAISNASKAYDYFLTTHNRNSVDDNGGDLLSVVNIGDSQGKGLDNAYWSGNTMFYGAGNTKFTNMAGSLDICGHEMTHGVIQQTANLTYKDQSGAINESMADIFGSNMDGNWLLGEDVIKEGGPITTGALRNMIDPNQGGNSLADRGWQPKHVNEIYLGDRDNGGVHINSGISNHAYYLISQQIGRDKADSIFYRALTQYLTRSSKFSDLRAACVASAEDIFAAAEIEAVEQGFSLVGITASNNNSNLPVLVENNGVEKILYVDYFTSELHLLNIASNEDKQLTATVAYSRPSVSDNGHHIAFVDQNKKIRLLTLNSTGLINEQEIEVSGDPEWNTVAISKDGTRLAATTNYVENNLYVLDLVTSVISSFELYTPAHEEGAETIPPLYAGSLEWDYSGQRVFYDAYNEISVQGEDKITYWDLNSIEVWDTLNNKIGSGEVEKLFSGLAKGVSLENPTFSKLSPHIMAFDYVDANNGVYQVRGWNMETNELGLIFDNNVRGWPSFSLDDKYVVIENTLSTGAPAIIKAKLELSKISGTGFSIKAKTNGSFPNTYAYGNRAPVTDIQDITPVLKPIVYPNPVVDKLFIKGMNAGRIMIFDQTGIKILEETVSEQIDLSNLPAGMYYVRLSSPSLVFSKKIIKR